MPRHKDLKRLVRARMCKTGEAYTAARAQIVKQPGKTAPAPAAPNASPQATPAPTPAPASRAISPKEYATLAGVSDDTLKAKTACTWERWVKALDHHGAETMSHREIAALVRKKYKVSGWWSQTVTVGYERIKGLRARGQRRDGTYEANKSRTYGVPVATLFDAWANPATRRRWMDGAPMTVRSAAKTKTMRLTWADGSKVDVGFLAKGPAKSAVAVQHAKLPDQESAERLKTYWAERLDVLGAVLAEQSNGGGMSSKRTTAK